MLFNADCLEVMAGLADASVDMIYLDPPFYTQKVQALSDPSGKRHEFSDIWDSLDGYLEHMRLRVSEMKRLLKPTGGSFLHCDTSASHHLRLLLDEIFGADILASENVCHRQIFS